MNMAGNYNTGLHRGVVVLNPREKIERFPFGQRKTSWDGNLIVFTTFVIGSLCTSLRSRRIFIVLMIVLPLSLEEHILMGRRSTKGGLTWVYRLSWLIGWHYWSLIGRGSHWLPPRVFLPKSWLVWVLQIWVIWVQRGMNGGSIVAHSRSLIFWWSILFLVPLL